MTDKYNAPVLIYEIWIQGKLDTHWSDWFNGTTDTLEKDSLNTRLLVSIPDQSRLRGILNKIWDLNLTVVSVNPISAEVKAQTKNKRR
ncbi:MAG: hypothetical protein JXA13_07390 [Anaerolineales bacterium]|nr:hypothetical protein [Anaerolineales bacterium]